MTAVVTAVTTTAVSGIGICMSNTGIFSLGGWTCPVDSGSTPKGGRKSVGGTTIAGKAGIFALGGFSSACGISKPLGKPKPSGKLTEGILMLN